MTKEILSQLLPQASCASGRLRVMKFGSSVLSDPSKLRVASQVIYDAWRQGFRVLAVVSALGDQTDVLLEEADALGATKHDDDESLAALLATGELRSAALLGLALKRAGIPTCVRDPGSIGLLVSGSRINAEPLSVDRQAIQGLLEQAPVLVVPGFVAQHVDGGLAVLGRGGSDLSAVYLAEQLDADDCVLLKDVDGVYTEDPAASASSQRYDAVTYVDALAVSERLIQPKAIERLRRFGRVARVTDVTTQKHTVVGAARSQVAQEVATASDPT